MVAHKILLSAPVPWIGDLGLGDWGLGLDNSFLRFKIIKELSSLSQTIQLHAPTSISEGRLDQTIHCYSAKP